MAKSGRCPVCGVPVKPENLVRHLDDTHPRHPEVANLRNQLREDARYRPAARPARPLRLRRIHLAVIAAAVLLGLGAYAAAPLLDPYGNFTIHSCIRDEGILHIHPQLKIVIQGSPFPIPGGIGISGSCTNPLHTHSGYDPTTYFVEIHIESPVRRVYTLGEFFEVWGEPFSSSRILNYVADGTNQVRMTVDGASSNAYGSLVLEDEQSIVITYGPVA